MNTIILLVETNWLAQPADYMYCRSFLITGLCCKIMVTHDPQKENLMDSWDAMYYFITTLTLPEAWWCLHKNTLSVC
jgi:hypothetical protein